jgi:hypothetical protein
MPNFGITRLVDSWNRQSLKKVVLCICRILLFGGFSMLKSLKDLMLNPFWSVYILYLVITMTDTENYINHN